MGWHFCFSCSPPSKLLSLLTVLFPLCELLYQNNHGLAPEAEAEQLSFSLFIWLVRRPIHSLEDHYMQQIFPILRAAPAVGYKHCCFLASKIVFLH